jgi:rod shape-determining protein MreD
MSEPIEIPFGLIVRLVVLGAVVVLVQTAAVSQLPILGEPADLSPLVVAAVGLLLGSVPGAVMGFAMGLFVDLALVQTLGLSSLVLTAVGYGAGRVREVREPDSQGALATLAVGSAATAAASIGYAIMQIALGVDAPVSMLLVRDILIGLVVNSLIALPVYVVVARWLWSKLPEDPRRRRRRAYTTGGLSPLSRS